MSEFGSFPSSTSSAAEREPDAIDDELDAIDKEEHIAAEAADIGDEDDNFQTLETPAAEPVEQAPAEAPQPEPEPRTIEELNTWEDLHRSEKLRQRVREVAFNRVTEINTVRDKIDETKGSIKWQLLDRKQQAQQEQYDRTMEKAKRARSERRKQKLVLKANKINRRLSNTNAVIANHNKQSGPRNSDGEREEGKKGKAEISHEKQLIERRRELERKRAEIIEKQIIAREKKRRRKQKTEGLRVGLSEKSHVRLAELVAEASDKSMGVFRRGVQGILKQEVDSRVNDYSKWLAKEKHKQQAA